MLILKYGVVVQSALGKVKLPGAGEGFHSRSALWSLDSDTANVFARQLT